MHHRLNGGEDVFLRYEAHLDVELIEFQTAVGAQILVAETRRDLEVTVEAGDHQQLLELLRGLGQRIKLGRMQPRRHQEIPCALR